MSPSVPVFKHRGQIYDKCSTRLVIISYTLYTVRLKYERADDSMLSVVRQIEKYNLERQSGRGGSQGKGACLW